MPKEIVLSSLQSLARPLVRLCLRHGIKLGELLDALKRVYVTQAEALLRKEDSTVSTSRITMMTGVHRTDVAHIRSEPEFKPRERHTASDVISQWRYDARFCSKPGHPRVLEFDSKTSEFAELVRSVSQSVSPYTVSFELERLGLITRTRDGKVKLVSRVFVPKGDPSSVLDMLGEDADDLFDSVEANAFCPSESDVPNHHLKTEYRSVPSASLPEIRDWLMREGSAFHERARNFLSRFDKDINPEIGGEGSHRVAVASFSIIDQATPKIIDQRDSQGEIE